ncbi:MAG: substrate-binding periplasmic protein [Kordiimonas sp.]
MTLIQSKAFLKLLTGLLCIVVSAFVALQANDEIIIYTEDYHPYSYVDEQGRIVGLSTDIVRKIMYESGLSYTIRLVPWARAYREVVSGDNTLVFSLARLKEREADFDWLAYLVRPEFYIFVKDTETRIVSVEGLKNGDFTAVCVVEDISCVLLRQMGFPEHKFLKKRDGGLSGSDMIAYGRADLYVGDIIHHQINPRGNKAKVKPVMRVGEGVGLYLASGLQLDKRIREKIRTAAMKLSR